jgi:hypothetical protein
MPSAAVLIRVSIPEGGPEYSYMPRCIAKIRPGNQMGKGCMVVIAFAMGQRRPGIERVVH